MGAVSSGSSSSASNRPAGPERKRDSILRTYSILAWGQRMRLPASGSIGLALQAARKSSWCLSRGSCGRLTTTTAKLGNTFKARAADSPKRRSRVNRQLKPEETAAPTRSPLERAFQPRLAAVSQSTPNSFKTWTRWTSMLTSSSHMKRISQLRGDLQNLRQCLMWKNMCKR